MKKTENISCSSFPPSADADCEILVLGSMPGGESLRKQEYYAFKYNAFWRIMGVIFSFDHDLPYSGRLNELRLHHIALWDVLSTCERAGSLDSGIAVPVPNDIPAFLKKYPSIKKIICNGSASAKYLKRFFPDIHQPVVQLPSTSPAAAMFTFSGKLSLWRDALKK